MTANYVFQLISTRIYIFFPSDLAWLPRDLSFELISVHRDENLLTLTQLRTCHHLSYRKYPIKANWRDVGHGRVRRDRKLNGVVPTRSSSWVQAVTRTKWGNKSLQSRGPRGRIGGRKEEVKSGWLIMRGKTIGDFTRKNTADWRKAWIYGMHFSSHQRKAGWSLKKMPFDEIITSSLGVFAMLTSTNLKYP